MGKAFFFLTQIREFGLLEKICTKEAMMLGFNSASDRFIVAFYSFPSVYHSSQLALNILRDTKLSFS